MLSHSTHISNKSTLWMSNLKCAAETPYGNYQQLLKSATQSHDQKNQVNPPRATCKVHNHNFMLELTKTSNASDENCGIDSTNPITLTRMMSTRGSRNRFKNDSNKNLTPDKDHIMPKESCAALTPESK